MRIVSAKELQQWLSQGQVIEQDGRGPKVVALSDGQLLKIFRPRRRFWLARLRPQAGRFANNAEKLNALGIRTPDISEVGWLDHTTATSFCIYSPLPGQSLDKLFQRERQQFLIRLPQLARFIRELHAKGVYFRSLHLGNILLLPEGGFGLIDFLDLRIKRRPLSRSLMRRNLQHLHSYLQRSGIEDFPWTELLSLYQRAN